MPHGEGAAAGSPHPRGWSPAQGPRGWDQSLILSSTAWLYGTYHTASVLVLGEALCFKELGMRNGRVTEKEQGVSDTGTGYSKGTQQRQVGNTGKSIRGGFWGTGQNAQGQDRLLGDRRLVHSLDRVKDMGAGPGIVVDLGVQCTKWGLGVPGRLEVSWGTLGAWRR